MADEYLEKGSISPESFMKNRRLISELPQFVRTAQKSPYVGNIKV